MPDLRTSQLYANPLRNVGIGIAGLATIILLFELIRGNAGSIVRLAESPTWSLNARVSSARQKSLDVIQNATLGFDKILVINLPERTDHHDGLVLSAAVSNINVEFVNGVRSDSISPKVLPAGHRHDKIPGWLPSWRAHMNAISRVVENGWATALIMEDDVDWDIRLKPLLKNFAVSSDYALRNKFTSQRWLADIDYNHVPVTSPYGDDWDVLWLGHCGMELPTQESTTVILHRDDATVPASQHQRSWDINAQPPLKDLPPHTRAVTRGARQGTCSLAYAVSQSGARKLLNDLGLQRLDDAFDLMLRDWCQGDNGHKEHVCISVLPQLFDHYRPAGSNIADSEINPEDDKVRDESYSYNIRWSVRLNMDKLLVGDTSYDDQWPDDRL